MDANGRKPRVGGPPSCRAALVRSKICWSRGEALRGTKFPSQIYSRPCRSPCCTRCRSPIWLRIANRRRSDPVEQRALVPFAAAGGPGGGGRPWRELEFVLGEDA